MMAQGQFPADAPVVADFQAVAETLRLSILEYYEAREESIATPRAQTTIETNSTMVERRGAPLLAMLAERRGTAGVVGDAVLDLGCGFGALSLYFAALGATVTAVDPIKGRMRVGRRSAQRHQLPVVFQQGRMESLDLPDAQFDIAVHNNSFCYITSNEDRQRALQHTLRVLRPGGWLVTRNPNRIHPIDQFSRLPAIHWTAPERTVRVAKLLGRPRSLVRLESPRQARKELEAAGFVDVAQAGFVDSERPDVLKVIARYHHFTARRPP